MEENQNNNGYPEDGNQTDTEESVKQDSIPETAPKLTFRKLFKYFSVAIILLVYGLIFFRIYMQNDTNYDLASQFLWNDATVSAYNNSPDNFSPWSQSLTSYSYTIGAENGDAEDTVVHVEHNTFSQSKDFEGMFKISDFVYIPQSEQVIITLRYNRTSLEELAELYSLEQTPSLNEDTFSFTVDNGKQYFTDYQYIGGTRFTYGYYRLIFNNIPLDDSIKSLSLNIYYCKDIKTETDIDGNRLYNSPLDYIQFYDSMVPHDNYSIKDALPANVTENLKKTGVFSD